MRASIFRHESRAALFVLASFACACASSQGDVTSKPLERCSPGPDSNADPVHDGPSGDAAQPASKQPSSNQPASNEPNKPPGAPFPEERVVGRVGALFGADPFWSERGDVTPAAVADLGVTWKLVTSIQVGFGYLHEAALSLDGSEVLVVSQDEGAIRHYDVKSKKLLGRYPVPGFTQYGAVSFVWPEKWGARQNVLVSGERSTFWLNLDTGEFTETSLPAGDQLRLEARRGLVGFAHRTVEPQAGQITWFWSPARSSDDFAAHFRFAERPDNWALSADGRNVAFLFYPSDEVEVFDAVNGTVKWKGPAPKYARGLALSPDGSLLAVGGAELRLIDTATGELVADDTSYGNNIHEARFTPDGKLLVVSAYDGKVRSYQVGDKKLGQKQLLSHAGTANVYALGFDESGRRLVSSSGDKTIKIWQR